MRNGKRMSILNGRSTLGYLAFGLWHSFSIRHLAFFISRGKGEKVGGLRSLNVRAHQQPGDRLARQTPPGARPNMGAGLVRPVTDSRVGRSSAGVTRRLDK